MESSPVCVPFSFLPLSLSLSFSLSLSSSASLSLSLSSVYSVATYYLFSHLPRKRMFKKRCVSSTTIAKGKRRNVGGDEGPSPSKATSKQGGGMFSMPEFNLKVRLSSSSTPHSLCNMKALTPMHHCTRVCLWDRHTFHGVCISLSLSLSLSPQGGDKGCSRGETRWFVLSSVQPEMRAFLAAAPPSLFFLFCFSSTNCRY